MSQCIEKLPHGKCGSSDALQVFLDDKGVHSGYCFACDTYVPDPYGGNPPKQVKAFKKSPEEIAAELLEISGCPSLDLPDRGLRQSSLEHYGVKMGVSEQDGTTPVFHYYPYHKNGELVGYKTRLVEGKHFYAIGSTKEADLFGWQRALETGARVLYITEGELDAVALYQALKNKNKGTKWEMYSPAVVSLQHGAGSAKKELARLASKITANFKDVVLVFDQDDVGDAAVDEAMQVLPKATAVTLPAKDPNECVIQGMELALCNAVLFKKDKPKNTRLIWAHDLLDEAAREVPMGLSWPWPTLTEYTRGMRLGETMYIGSGVKMGKTTIVATLIAHLITEHNMQVFCAQPEEATPYTTRLVMGKLAKRIFHDPKIKFDHEAYDRARPLIQDKLILLDLYQSLDWTTLRSDIHAAVREGCQAVFIDPVTNLTNLVDSGEANTILQEFAQELAFMAKDLNIMVFIFCHLKAPLQGSPHERGGAVHSSQFAGSRAMMRSCHLMLGLEGNKDPDKEEADRNMRRLIILEDRAYGATGYITLYYDTKTGLYHEMKEVSV